MPRELLTIRQDPERLVTTYGTVVIAVMQKTVQAKYLPQSSACHPVWYKPTQFRYHNGTLALNMTCISCIGLNLTFPKVDLSILLACVMQFTSHN